MILVRFRNDKEREIILEADESKITEKIHSLNLGNWHDYFYERDKFEKLGLDSDVYDYYSIYTSKESMERSLK